MSDASSRDVDAGLAERPDVARAHVKGVKAADVAVRVVARSALDVARHAAMQQRVFGHVLEENGIPLERLGPEVFAWKLAPPRGEGKVAVAERDGALLASLSAYPLELGGPDGPRRGWHLCDAATLAEARGQGLYSRVFDALCAALPADEWLFAFPNGQSRPAFVRRDFATLVEVPLWFRPTVGGARLGEGVIPVRDFGPAHDAFAERLSAARGVTAVRSAAYLSWRYGAHPYFDYQAFELRRDGSVEGLLVVNRMPARGRVSLWVMELLGLDRRAERALALTARHLAREQGCDAMLSMSSARLPGALRVPPCFLPKKHVLMARRAGGGAEGAGAWHVQTGDWDTF